jgi:RES domain-containing protein
VILWRVSNHPALDGGGGLRASGRWHTRGRRVVYCAPSPAAALLEVLAHGEIDSEDIPVTFRYMEIEVPDSATVETVDMGALGPGWQNNLGMTQRLGDEWLRSGRTALLRVPSVIVPATWNVLVNPRHPESTHIRIARVHDQPIDPRLLR